MGFYNLVLGGIPTFTESQSKCWAGLQLIYKHRSFAHNILRSAIKLFPWQLGHMGAIRSAYQADALSIFLSTSAGILFLIFLLMGLLCKDKRHLADFLAGTQVQLNNSKRGWDKSPSLSIVFGLSSKTQWLSGLYYADFISFYSPTQLCGGGTTKSNSNELPISVPLSFNLP